MSIEPLGKRFLIEEIIEEEKTASGFILPDSEKPQKTHFKGRVAGIGPLCEQKEEKLGINAMVLFLKHGPVSVSDASGTYLLVNEGDILAVLN